MPEQKDTNFNTYFKTGFRLEIFKQISTVVHDDDTGHRLPTPRFGMEGSKTQCGSLSVWLFMAAAGRGRSGPLPVMAGVAVVLLALLVGADARAGGSHVTWAVRNGAAPPLSVRACLLFGSQHHPRAGAIAREPGACGCVPTCRAGTLL